MWVDENIGRVANERTVETFRDITRKLTVAGSFEAVADLIDAGVRELVEVSQVAVFRYDEVEHALRPVTGDADKAVGPDDDSVVWDAFVSSESVVEAREGDNIASAGSVLAASLDGFGAFVVDSPEPQAFDGVRGGLVHLLGDIAVQSLERLHREHALDQRERELQRQSDRLDRLQRANQTLLDVKKAIANAETREALETAVVEELAKADRFTFVWIGGLDGDRLVPRAWSGVERGYLDDTDFSLPTTNGAPSARAARDRTPVHVSNVSHGLGEEPWRRRLLNRGIQEILSLPLSYGDAIYGVLTVCADVPSTFDELSRSVFVDIADAVAYGIDIVERERTLANGGGVELEVRLADSTDLFQRLAREVNGTVSFDGVVSQPEGTRTLYLSVTDAPTSRVLEFLENAVSVDDVAQVVDRGEDGSFAVTMAEPTLVSWLTATGTTILQLTATPSETRLRVELATSTNVRGFLESLQEEYADAELIGRQSRERKLESRGLTATRLTEQLTDRQLEVLHTAYLNGYFEWPRERSGEEVASQLGITQPTFNNHLRVAERKLFSALFDDDTAEWEHT